MPHLSLSLLGGFQATLDGESIAGFESAKVRALLAYLAVEIDRPCRRDTLAALLWPDWPDRAARANLRRALSNLRRALRDHEAVPPFLLVTRDTIQFNSTSDHSLDVQAFRALVESSEPGRLASESLENAVSLYQGRFLEGFSLRDSAGFEDWSMLVRDRLQRQASTALHRLAEEYEQRGEYERACHYARRRVELEPWQEEAHQQLMRLLALCGRRSAALVQYETCRHVLQKELDVEPTEATTRLYERIRDGTIATEALEAVGARPSSLPVPLIPLIGRETELCEIGQLVDDSTCRLLTLVGPGGSGKTRLAVEAARAILSRNGRGSFADGVFLVSLAALGSVDSIVPAVAQAVGFSFYPGGEPRKQLLNYVRRKEMLLVMDSYEHLLTSAPSTAAGGVEGGAELAADILRAAPRVRILATSRSRLSVPGEQLYPVTGMAYPPPDLDYRAPDLSGTDRDRLSDIAKYGAVQLFVHGARRVRPGFQPAEDDWRAIAEVCRFLDGIPLAILMAAAWVSVLTPGEIADQLTGQGLDLLEADWHGVPERQRTMRAVFDHSWSLLSARHRTVMQALSVFRGGFSREAAQRVADATFQDLLALANRSLLHRTPTGRYELHELLRRYAEGRLGESEIERRQVLDRHCAYYAEFLARREADRHRRGPGDAWVEIDNVRAAWRWAVHSKRSVDIGTSLGGLFWFDQGAAWGNERRTFLGQAVEILQESRPTIARDRALGMALCYYGYSSRSDDPAALASIREGLRVLQAVGADSELAQCNILAVLRGIARDDAQAIQLLDQSISIFRRTDEPLEAPRALLLRAGFAQHRGEYAEAEHYLHEGLKIAEQIGSPRGVAIAYGGLGHLAYERGQYADARKLHRESRALFREMGIAQWALYALRDLGYVALALRDYDEARVLFQDCQAESEATDEFREMRQALCGLGDVALATGGPARAQQYYRRALQIPLSDLDQEQGRGVLVSLARLLAHRGEQERAVELLERALSFRSGRLVWLYGAKKLLEEQRSRLPQEVFAAAQERGRARELGLTVAELLAEL